MKRLGIYFSLFIVLLTLSCGKEDYIDDVPVDITITANRFSELTGEGGYVLLRGGVAGIILYRTETRQLVAYDRCSTYDPDSKCAVNVNEPSTIATDPCSDSFFNLKDGSGSSLHGPATRPLKKYFVTETSSQIRIYN